MAFGTAGKSKMGASLLLQLTVYYNAIASAMYFVLMCFVIYKKRLYWMNDDPYLVAAFAMWAGGEVLRLPFTFYGNTNEDVPSLAASLLLTCFPMAPAMLYLLAGQYQPMLPLECILGPIVCLFAIAEFPMVYRNLKYQAEVQRSRFIRLTLSEEA